MQETFIYINTSVTPSSEDNFRIWITTEVHPKFSISLLQISIHYTYEPPEGLYAFKNIYIQYYLEIINGFHNTI